MRGGRFRLGDMVWPIVPQYLFGAGWNEVSTGLLISPKNDGGMGASGLIKE